MSSAAKRDYYEVLELARTATPDEIKSAYRKAALKYHPDRNPGDHQAEDRFKEASEAYAVLSDAEKRARYDQFGHAGLGATGFEGFGNFGSMSDIFGDIFSEFFGMPRGGRGRGPVPSRGADLRYDLELSFEKAVFGADVQLEIPRPKRCETCNGSGSRPGTGPRACPTCGGTGELRFSQGFFSVTRACNQCGGAGRVISDPCQTCRGQGKLPDKVSLSGSIPPGVDNGTRVRVTGQGEPGELGGPPGDLYVFTHVQEHALFQREGTEIFCEVPIRFVDAALGATIEIPTLEGKEEVKIPAGTQTGKILRLKGKGVPSIRGRQRGDQHVRLVVEVPTHLSKKQKKILEEFAAESDAEIHPQSKSFKDKVRELFG